MGCPNCGYEPLNYPFYTVITPVREFPEMSKTEQVQWLDLQQKHGADIVLLHTPNKTYVVKNRWGATDRLPERVVVGPQGGSGWAPRGGGR